MPDTSIIAAIIIFLDALKFTLFSTSVLSPIAEIIPYTINEIPPIISVGIVLIKLSINGKNDKSIAIIAATLKTNGSHTPVNATTPVFSEYVVFAGPPINPASEVPMPSPSNVLVRPGSFIKSLPQVPPIAAISPICSITAASATTTNTIIASALNFGK